MGMKEMVGNQEKRGGGSREERGDLDDWVYIPHIRSYEISIYVCIVVCSVVYLHLGILRKRGRGGREEREEPRGMRGCYGDWRDLRKGIRIVLEYRGLLLSKEI